MADNRRDSVIGTVSLTKRYGDLEALKDLTIDVPPGAVGLLGPNGAGKSTLIKCLLGLVERSSGSSEVLGHSSGSLSSELEARRRIGYVPENDCLIIGMNALKFVKYMGEVSGLPSSDAMQRAHEVLHYVGIGDERYRKISSYSTGMKQKVKLAQAMVHDPELVILDEPTNGMDPKGRQEMLDLIRDISTSHGKNILFSSHLLPDVEYVCDQLMIMDQGRVVVQGGIDELKGDASHFDIRIKGDEEVFRKVLGSLSLDFEKRGSYFRVNYREDLLLEILRAIRGKDIQIRHATRATMSLEDLFVKNITGVKEK